MRTIILYNRKHQIAGRTIVDDEDYELVSQYRWHLSYGYVMSDHTRMHRLIMNPPEGYVVDHINHYTTDNRRSNLRICKQGDNVHNSCKTSSRATSPYKGVTVNRNRWRARIKADGQWISLGCYGTPEEAARAYDRAALDAWGEYAYTNFPATDYEDNADIA